MKNTLSHTKEILKLNRERNTRFYTAEVINTTIQGDKKNNTSIALGFNLTYLGLTNQNTLQYKLKVDYRYFLNEKLNALKKINKAQKLAAKIATINNTLHLELTNNFKLLKVLNTSEIRSKWNTLKPEILKDFPDLSAMASDFDWQLQEQNIQQIYLNDNFYNFFFPSIFNLNFDEAIPLINNKIISNGVGEIDIPITEKKHIKFEDRALTKAIVLTEAEVDVNSKHFSLPKLNTFIGDLDTVAGNNYDLDFNYKGKYIVNAEFGEINKGELTYFFSVGDVYNNKTTIHFNLESNE
ncbi:hypothetical protein [Lacinutrix salivirga]